MRKNILFLVTIEKILGKELISRHCYWALSFGEFETQILLLFDSCPLQPCNVSCHLPAEFFRDFNMSELIQAHYCTPNSVVLRLGLLSAHQHSPINYLIFADLLL